jgi:hypothetical protein
MVVGAGAVGGLTMVVVVGAVAALVTVVTDVVTAVAAVAVVAAVVLVTADTPLSDTSPEAAATDPVCGSAPASSARNMAVRPVAASTGPAASKRAASVAPSDSAAGEPGRAPSGEARRRAWTRAVAVACALPPISCLRDSLRSV